MFSVSLIIHTQITSSVYYQLFCAAKLGDYHKIFHIKKFLSNNFIKTYAILSQSYPLIIIYHKTHIKFFSKLTSKGISSIKNEEPILSLTNSSHRSKLAKWLTYNKSFKQFTNNWTGSTIRPYTTKVNSRLIKLSYNIMMFKYQQRQWRQQWYQCMIAEREQRSTAASYRKGKISNACTSYIRNYYFLIINMHILWWQ